MRNQYYIIFKADHNSMLSWVTVQESEIPAAIDQLCLKDDEYMLIKGTIIKDLGESKMNITPNLLRG